jgi:hypothetical protein
MGNDRHQRHRRHEKRNKKWVVWSSALPGRRYKLIDEWLTPSAYALRDEWLDWDLLYGSEGLAEFFYRLGAVDGGEYSWGSCGCGVHSARAELEDRLGIALQGRRDRPDLSSHKGWLEWELLLRRIRKAMATQMKRELEKRANTDDGE